MRTSIASERSGVRPDEWADTRIRRATSASDEVRMSVHTDLLCQEGLHV